MSTVDKIGDALSFLIFAMGFIAVGAGVAVAAVVAWRSKHGHR